MVGEKEYIEWIDLAKGLGIWLVIAGHTFSLDVISPIYAFHMPLFFFLSGLVYNRVKYADFSVLIRAKTRQLLKPWCLMLLVSLLVCLVIPNWREQISVSSFLRDLYTANTNVVQNSSLWYLPCLFITILIFFVIDKLPRNKVITYGGLVVMLLLPFVLRRALQWGGIYVDLPDDRLPFKADSALIAVCFFACGAYYRNEFNTKISSFRHGILSLIFFGLILLMAKLNGWVNLNALEFGRYKILFYPIAFGGILSVCLLSSAISASGCSVLKKTLLFYGKNSLIIFGFQSLFIRLYLLINNYLFETDMVLYGNNPMEHQIISFLVVTFVCAPVLVFFAESVRRRMSRTIVNRI